MQKEKNCFDKQIEFTQLVKEYNAGKVKKYTLLTFGCQMNENDSEKLAGYLIEMGYKESENKEEADLIIYNTCCVRKNAEQKVYGHLGALKKLKRDNPELIICVCGCMMQQPHVVKHITKVYRHVDIIFGTHNIHKFPELLYAAVDSNTVIVDVWEEEGSIAENMPVKRSHSVKAWVTIMHGCNNFCSYCIVPYVRGRERSRKPEDIVEEVKSLEQKGYREITLLGQNVNSYRSKENENIDFAGLIYELEKINGIERLRFMTSHPKDLSDRLIDAMKDCKKVCEHLHLPLQSGSSGVLKKMNRGYSKEGYLELVDRIRSKIPDIALTTDIIVGFPGETGKDFEDTLDVVEKVRYDMAYTFLYSKRSGTPAARSPYQVSEDEKKTRFNQLLSIQNRISREINEKLNDETVQVLVEGLSKNSKNAFTGRTRTNKTVNFKGNNNLIGKLVNVRINKVQTWSLEGEVI